MIDVSIRAKFILEKLENCSLFTAIKILHCRRKLMNAREDCYLIYPVNLWTWDNWYRQHTFYMQSVDIYQPITNALLMENVVAQFCCESLSPASKWVFVFSDNETVRIIAGIGKGIVLSRNLDFSINLQQELQRTVMYLRRFDNYGQWTIVSNCLIDEIDYVAFSLLCKKIHLHSEGISALEEFASTRKIRLVLQDYSRYLNGMLSAAVIAMAVPISIQGIKIWELQNFIDHHICSSKLRSRDERVILDVNEHNIGVVEKLCSSLKNSVPFLEIFADLPQALNGANIEKLAITQGEIRAVTRSASNKTSGSNTICIKR